MRQVENMSLKTSGNALGLRAQNAVVASWAKWQERQIMSHRLAKAEAAAFGDEVDELVAELKFEKYEAETEKRLDKMRAAQRELNPPDWVQGGRGQ